MANVFEGEYSETVDETPSDHIRLEVMYETARAFMVLNPDGEEVSIPKSQIIDTDEDVTTEYGDGTDVRYISVKIEPWLIEKHNLI